MKTLLLIISALLSLLVNAHQAEKPPSEKHQIISQSGEVTYLGNTGLMVSHGDQQIMFDPFFHSHYNNYQLVPADIRTAIFTDQAPYDSVEMILISHAHGDHFDATDVVEYLKRHPDTKLLAPTQAVEQLKTINGFETVANQISGIDLVYGDQPIEMAFGEINVGIVRIPHAGWPGRADVSNLVYRVTLNHAVTVMHMGDADPDDVHFKPWASYWEKQLTNKAFPPYWFLTHPEGKRILSDRINAEHHIGVHVPVEVPNQLRYSGKDFFSEPGKVIKLKPNKNNTLPKQLSTQPSTQMLINDHE